VGINHAALIAQERTARFLRFERIEEDQGEMGPFLDFPPGVAGQKLPGTEAQILFQAQDIIRAQKDGGGAAAAVETGQSPMAMEAETAVHRQALVLLLIKRDGFGVFGSHSGKTPLAKLLCGHRKELAMIIKFVIKEEQWGIIMQNLYHFRGGNADFFTHYL
jgi:hypothetical protein